jgi:hypothetical protein
MTGIIWISGWFSLLIINKNFIEIALYMELTNIGAPVEKSESRTLLFKQSSLTRNAYEPKIFDRSPTMHRGNREKQFTTQLKSSGIWGSDETNLLMMNSNPSTSFRLCIKHATQVYKWDPTSWVMFATSRCGYSTERSVFYGTEMMDMRRKTYIRFMTYLVFKF